MNILWIVGKTLPTSDKTDSSWEFIGVFDTEELALKNCRTYEYFMGPTQLNVAFSHETVAMKSQL